MKQENKLDSVEQSVPSEYESIKNEVVKGISAKIGTIDREMSSKRNIATKEYNQQVQQLKEINEKIELTDKYANDLKIAIRKELSNYNTLLKSKYNDISQGASNVLTKCNNELYTINKYISNIEKKYSEAVKTEKDYTSKTPSKEKLDPYIITTSITAMIGGIILSLFPLVLVITFYIQAIYHSYISYSHELLIITLLTIIGYPLTFFSLYIVGETIDDMRDRAGTIVGIIIGLLMNSILIILPVYLLGWSDLIDLMRVNTANTIIHVITSKTLLTILWIIEISAGITCVSLTILSDKKSKLTDEVSRKKSELNKIKARKTETIKKYREKLSLYSAYLNTNTFFSENDLIRSSIHDSDIELGYVHRKDLMNNISGRYLPSYNEGYIDILTNQPGGIYDKATRYPDKITSIEDECKKEIDAKRKSKISFLETKREQISNDKRMTETQISNIETSSKEEKNKAHQSLISNYDAMNQNLSEHSLLLTPSYVSPTQPQSHVMSGKCDHQLLLEQAKQRYILPYILLGKEWCENNVVSTDKFLIPIYAPWQSTNGLENRNFAIFHDRKSRSNAVELMNNLLLNMLMAFSPKKLQFTCIDLMYSGDIIHFTSKLDNSLYQIINTESELRNAVDSLQSGMLDLQKRRLSECKNIMEYNVKNSTITDPYKVIILLDYSNNMSTSLIASLKPFVENGYKGGIFFVILVNEEMNQNHKSSSNVELLSKENFNFIKTTESKEEIELNNKRITTYYISELNTTPLISTENKTLLDTYFEAIKKEAAKKEKPISLQIDGNLLYNIPYQDATKEFKITIGKRNGKDVYFELNEKDHVHSFILGMSGSGKSVLLHDIISIATLKYSPETLQLYLMDFKLGGVEFNQYKNLKHARAILVDDSDKPITLEILRNLYREMAERGKTMSAHGVTEFGKYNALTQQKFPRIILAIDECHELFSDRADQVQLEINSIISRIAKEGRSKGVHLLMATQTFSNSNIPPELLKNITDPYILKSNDSDRLVKNSDKEVDQIKQSGETYYPFKDGGSCLFQPFNAKVNLSDNISLAIQKSKSYINNTFYYSGKQTCKLQPEYCPPAINKVVVGKKISLDAKSVEITFRPNDPNLAVIGINEKNACRVCFSAILSRMCSTSVKEKDIFIINCINPEEEGSAWIAPIINHLENNSRCVVIGQSRKKTSELLLHLNATIENNTTPLQNTMLVILGQKRFRDLMNDNIIDVPQRESQALSPKLGYGSEARNKVRPSGFKTVTTYKSILKNILENGPDKGIHTIIQVDRPENLLFDDTFSPKEKAIHFFANQVYLRTAEEISSTSRLPEEIKLKALSSDDPERLRAYFYNAAHSPSSILFMPFVLPESDEINKFIKE